MASSCQKVIVCISDIDYYITKSPKHLDDGNRKQETLMTTQISTKLAALGMALLMNSAMIGGIAYLFNAQAALAGQTEISTLATA
jgi:hypothetical protein